MSVSQQGSEPSTPAPLGKMVVVVEAGRVRSVSLLTVPVAGGGYDQMCGGKRSPFVGDIAGNMVEGG